MKFRNRWTLGLILVVFFLAACGTSGPFMPVPPSLAAVSSPMMVERVRAFRPKKPLRFGEWQVTKFSQNGPTDRKTTRGAPDLRYTRGRRWATYEFVLTGAAEAWQCDCKFARRSRSVEMASRRPVNIGLEINESLECDLRREGGDATWKLRIDGSPMIDGEGYAGTLDDGSRRYSLRASHAIENLTEHMPGRPVGYIFVRDGSEIASTELIEPGAVRIADDVGADRDLIATAAAALLLQPY